MLESRLKLETKITLRKNSDQLMEVTLEEAKEIYEYLSTILMKKAEPLMFGSDSAIRNR